ncbi:hypothetical protein VSU19_19930 [Verrucomicrobiales bacterium BCK34]|nr:hypothetical protein [Verrucomicrobiales bacterium BCK34]
MKKAILVAIIGAMTLGVNAGDWGKAPVAPAKAPIEECYDIGGEISAGYMSDYIFHGSRIARDTVWTDVNYTIDSIVPITIGASYFNFINTPANGVLDDKLDLYASAALGTFAGFDTSLGYTHYFFPETATGSFGNINLDLRRSLGFADLLIGTNYAVGGNAALNNGWYHHAGVEKSFGITDAMSLVIGAGVGYNDQYIVNSSGWSNYYVTAALPIELNCRATLTPYIGYNGSITQAGGGQVADLLPGAGNHGDVLSAGVSLSVSF